MFAALTMLLIPSALSADALTLSTREGQAPLHVCIDGPPEVLKRFKECRFSMGWHGWSGNGISLNWGDGQPVGQFENPETQGASCAHLRCHEFAAPGDYKIAVRLWHPGPTDAPITDWVGEATVRVLGQPRAPKFELLNPRKPEVVGYAGEPVPRWKLDAGGKVDLRFRVLAKSGRQLFEKTQSGLAYSGEGRESFSISPEQYAELIKADQGEFFYRFDVLRDDKVLQSVDSPRLRMTWEIPRHDVNRTQLEPSSGRAPLKVTLRHDFFLKACHAYKVDWGDGSPPTAHVQGPILNGCRVDPGELVLSHVYKRPGEYKVRLFFEEGTTLRDLNQPGPHNVFLVKVGRP